MGEVKGDRRAGREGTELEWERYMRKWVMQWVLRWRARGNECCGDVHEGVSVAVTCTGEQVIR